MGGYGCLVAVLASSLSQLGYDVTPKILNEKFREGNVYTDSGQVIWYKIHDLFPRVDYHYQRIFDGKTFEKDLAEGRLPVVQVKYYGTGAFHWVLIVGSDQGDFLIMDPLMRAKKYIRLGTHGRIYSYRVLVKK